MAPKNKFTREEMIDEVVRTNGLEDKWTIWFCELAEDSNISDSALTNAMICARTVPTRCCSASASS